MFHLGDSIARMLSSVGITKELAGRVAGKDCGCSRRQEAMNQVGFRWQIAAMLAFVWVSYYFSKFRSLPFWSRLRVSCRFFSMALRVLVLGRP